MDDHLACAGEKVRLHYVYGYARASSSQQVESGLGIDAQQDRILRYYDDVLKPRGLTWGKMFVDAGQSAFKKAMPDRPQGRILLAIAQPADHVVVAKHDRAFRQVRDFCACFEPWVEQGVIIHCLNIGLDTSNKAGLLMAKLVAIIGVAVAQSESESIGERVEAAVEQVRKRGKHWSRRLGFKYGGSSRRTKPEPDEETRALCRAIAEQVHEGQRFGQIAWSLNKAGLRRLDKRRKRPTEGTSRWDARTVQQYYLAYLRLVAEGEIPPVENHLG